MTEESRLVAGFSVRGYRSLSGETAWIAPLAKITCLIGPNNSGKSNVLRAAQLFLPGFSAAQTAMNQLAPLDRPRPAMAGESELGIAYNLGPDPVVTLAARIPSNIRDRWDEPSLRQVLTPLCEGLHEVSQPPCTDGDAPILWRRWTVGASSAEMILSADLDRIVDEKYPTDARIPMGRLGHELTGTTGGPPADDLNRLINWCLPLPRLTTQMIPSSRNISQPNEYSNSSEPPPDGTGLPYFLQRLQSPAAEIWDEERAKFARINQFLSGVIERPAELRVPHDNSGVYVDLGGQVMPLDHLGDGVGQLVLIATLATLWERQFVCLEEPEVNLHPLLLRSLVRYLHERTSNQYLIATHSSHLLNDPNVSVLKINHDAARGSQVSPAITRDERHDVAHRLGYRASDLLQANAIVWVEGPSDRVYLDSWLRSVDHSLVEGIHYSVMFYGGRLLARLSGVDADDELISHEALDQFIRLPDINRHMAILIDSDKKSDDDPLNKTKVRITAEFESRSAFVWVTQGREIENYIPIDDFTWAVKQRHPKASRPTITNELYQDRFEDWASPDKVRIAEHTVSRDVVWPTDVLDRTRELVHFIRSANRGTQAAVQV